ncbi:MAG: hypothetical protein OJF52_000368 [Nitrospira sp.]|jgi:hypothetical protein|nr:MAG: hypothetical protein OJF52_000368 [Nitrospira sp.]
MDLEKIDLERAGEMDPEVFSEKRWLQAISLGLSMLHNDMVDVQDSLKRLQKTFEYLKR